MKLLTLIVALFLMAQASDEQQRFHIREEDSANLRSLGLPSKVVRQAEETEVDTLGGEPRNLRSLGVPESQVKWGRQKKTAKKMNAESLKDLSSMNQALAKGWGRSDDSKKFRMDNTKAIRKDDVAFVRMADSNSTPSSGNVTAVPMPATTSAAPAEEEHSAMAARLDTERASLPGYPHPQCDCKYMPTEWGRRGGCMITMAPPIEGYACYCHKEWYIPYPGPGYWKCSATRFKCNTQMDNFNNARCRANCFYHACCLRGGGNCAGYDGDYMD